MTTKTNLIQVDLVTMMSIAEVIANKSKVISSQALEIIKLREQLSNKRTELSKGSLGVTNSIQSYMESIRESLLNVRMELTPIPVMPIVESDSESELESESESDGEVVEVEADEELVCPILAKYVQGGIRIKCPCKKTPCLVKNYKTHKLSGLHKDYVKKHGKVELE